MLRGDRYGILCLGRKAHVTQTSVTNIVKYSINSSNRNFLLATKSFTKFQVQDSRDISYSIDYYSGFQKLETFPIFFCCFCNFVASL